MFAALQAAFTRWTTGKEKPAPSTASSSASPRDPCRSEMPPLSGLCWLTRRLGADEVHSILQLLPINSLALVSATCRQLRNDALHPASGRFLSCDLPFHSNGLLQLPVLSPCPASSYSYNLGSTLSYTGMVQMLDSAIFRTHTPVCLHPGKRGWWSERPLVDRVALMQLVDSCAKIKHLDLEASVYNWAERTAIQLLSAQAMRQIHYVRQVAAGSLWITNERVQIALLSLPSLTRIEITFASGHNRPGLAGRLSPRAFACAQQLREVWLLDLRVPLRSIAALSALPNGVRALRLSNFDPDEPCQLLSEWGRVASVMRLDRLESLQLADINLALTERSWVRRCFQGMPCLQRVRVKQHGIHALLRGLIDAGVDSLPALRIVEWSADSDEGEESILRPPTGDGIDLPRKLLRRFPLVHLHVWEDGADEERLNVLRAFSGWDRVMIRRSNVTDVRAAADLAADLATLREDGIEFPPNPPQPCAADLRDEWVPEVADPPEAEDDEEEEQTRRV